MYFSNANLTVEESDVLVDVGCGKGRVIISGLGRGFTNRIVGLELDEDVAAATRKRLTSYPNVTVLTGDAVENLPEDGTLFYLFNSFEQPIVTRFKARWSSCSRGSGPFV